MEREHKTTIPEVIENLKKIGRVENEEELNNAIFQAFDGFEE